MTFAEFDTNKQRASIHRFAESVMTNFPLELRSIECINFEFNATFKVSDIGGAFYALRININSKRSNSNLAAEVEFVRFLRQHSDISLPTPIALKDGTFFGSAFHNDSQRSLNYVLYSWLQGEEIGHIPQLQLIRRLGALMAKMHEATTSFEFGGGASLESLRDPLWGQMNNLFGPASKLSLEIQNEFSVAIRKIDTFLDHLYSAGTPQPIHADLHGGNVLEFSGELSVLDFDDCAIGYPLQDLATTLYYLDTEEQDAALLEGYSSVRELPKFTKEQMQLLLLQRRLVLLNYLLETSTPEHREMVPKYLEESLIRVKTFLDK